MAKQNEVIYPVIFEKDDDYVLATVPDIGFSTEGDNYLDAARMAEDLIGGTLEDMKSFPEPTEIDQLELEAGQHVAFVTVDIDAYRRKNSRVVRKSVSVPEYLSVMAKEKGLNVSQVLTEALEAKLLNA